MEDFEGTQRYAEYKNFRVDDEMVISFQRMCQILNFILAFFF